MIDKRKYVLLYIDAAGRAMMTKLFPVLILTAAAAFLSGCGTVAKLAGTNEKCVVIAERSQIRSSGALVAADLLVVKRGTQLEILGEDVFEGEGYKAKWYNVRASDEDNTEGWIEASDVMTGKMLAESKKLYEEDKDTPAQATGQLRAATNLRLTPDRSIDDNILQKLVGGDTFEIVGWRRIPKPPDPEDTKNKDPKDKDDKPEDVRLDDKYETWYKVRLNISVSPAPAGWLYGKQVELTVPADIIFYRTGREFVAWSRLDGEQEGNIVGFVQTGKDAGKEGKPGSWVILERSSKIQDPNGTDEPDFDHIRVMGYDKYSQDHYKVYLSGKVKGYLPLRVKGSGDTRTFTVKIKDASGNLKDFTFQTYKDSKGLLKVTAPPDIPKESREDR
jgi:hypothetical protein